MNACKFTCLCSTSFLWFLQPNIAQDSIQECCCPQELGLHTSIKLINTISHRHAHRISLIKTCLPKKSAVAQCRQWKLTLTCCKSGLEHSFCWPHHFIHFPLRHLWDPGSVRLSLLMRAKRRVFGIRNLVEGLNIYLGKILLKSGAVSWRSADISVGGAHPNFCFANVIHWSMHMSSLSWNASEWMKFIAPWKIAFWWNKFMEGAH